MPRHASKNGFSALSFFAFSLLLCVVLFLFSLITSRFYQTENRAAEKSIDTSVTVILDAGHGGEDGGAIGVNGVYEKDLNLAITKQIASDLKEKGISVICTRNEDVLLYDKTVDYKGRKKMLDLAARLKIARDTENSIFISIHMNSFPQSKYNGLQVYYSKNDSRSSELANRIQERIREQLQPSNTRKTKAASSGIYLLDRISSPAVLIECGFLSNPAECELLSEETYQKQLSALLADTIADYVNSLS